MGAGKPMGAQAPVTTEPVTPNVPEASPPGGLLAKMLAEAEAAKKAKLESATQATAALPAFSEKLKGTPFYDAMLKAAASKSQQPSFLKPQTKQVPTLDSLLAYQKQQQEIAAKAKAEAEAKAAAEQAKATAEAKAAQDAAIQAELAKNTFVTSDLPGAISAQQSYVPSAAQEKEEEISPQSSSPFPAKFEELMAKAKTMQKTASSSTATTQSNPFVPSSFFTTGKEQQQKGINMGPGYASMSEQFFVPGYKEKMEKLFGKKV